MRGNWEGYQRCAEEDVPPVLFWVLSDFEPKGYEVWYGNTGPELKQWGAPFRRIKDKRKQVVTYYRFIRGGAPKERARDSIED